MNEETILRSLFGDQIPTCFGSEKTRNVLEACDVLWTYQGDPSPDRPHALLTSGLHSDGFVNVGAVLKECPTIRGIFAQSLLTQLQRVWTGHINWVVGADTSSTALAADVAEIIGARHVKMVKVDEGKIKRQNWSDDNQPLRAEEVGLQVEELITTSLSASLVREGITRANFWVKINYVPYIPVIVDRSDPDDPVTKLNGSSVISLLRLEIRNFAPDKCPYCKVGSIALKPKEVDNWAKLTQK